MNQTLHMLDGKNPLAFDEKYCRNLIVKLLNDSIKYRKSYQLLKRLVEYKAMSNTKPLTFVLKGVISKQVPELLSKDLSISIHKFLKSHHWWIQDRVQQYNNIYNIR